MNSTSTNRVARPRNPGRRAVLRVAGTFALLISGLAGLAGCGGSGVGTVTAPAIGPARVARLTEFQPSGPVMAGRPTPLSFTIQQASGEPLVNYRTCCEPHAGVDLIIVRSDDSHVQHDDSDISHAGQVTQPVVFPTPGHYLTAPFTLKAGS